MANVFDIVFSQDFTNQTRVVVAHNTNMQFLGIQLVAGGVTRPDLIAGIELDKKDPLNVLTVNLAVQTSGCIQVYKPSMPWTTLLTPTEKVAITIGDVYASSTTSSSTTDITWQTKISKTTVELPAGTYRVGWAFAWGYTTTDRTRSFQAQVAVDSLPVWGATLTSTTGNKQNSASAFTYVTFTKSGLHTVLLQYRASDKADTAEISEAHLEMRQVA